MRRSRDKPPVSPYRSVESGKQGLWVNRESSIDLDTGDSPAETIEGAVEAAQEVADRLEQDKVEVKMRKLIRLPSAAEQRRHAKTHIPFMPWCPECVAGRKPNWGHYTIPQDERERTQPEVHLDYCFFRSRPGGVAAPTIVLKDRDSRAIAAHVVAFKGGGLEWAVSQVMRDLAKWGIRGNIVPFC